MGSLEELRERSVSLKNVGTSRLSTPFPEADPQEYQLQPTKLSYKTAWHDPSDAGFTEVAIIGARVLTNNLT
jgi:hypothetical protein